MNKSYKNFKHEYILQKRHNSTCYVDVFKDRDYYKVKLVMKTLIEYGCNKETLRIVRIINKNKYRGY